MPEKRLVWLALAWLLLVPALASGQERQQLSLGAGTPVTVYADRLENRERERLLLAEGNVQLEQGDIRLEADRLEVNTETGEAIAAGKVVLFDGRDRMTGERLEYNLRAGTGLIYKAAGVAEPHFFFTGNRMDRFGDKAYRISGGTFTTCEDESPAWSVRLGSATAYLDDWMWGTSGSFWVWKIPVVPFLPVFATSLRRDRHTGLLTPTFGSSEDKGFYVRQPIYITLGDSQDLTLIPAYYEKRGFGLAGSYRYVRRETSRGEIDGFYLHDTAEATEAHPDRDSERWVVGLRHEEVITPRLVLKADLARVSDNTFLGEFGDSLDERSRQRLESNLSLSQRWDKWNFVGRLFFYQDLTTELPVELNRLPELRLNAFQQPVPGLPGLLYELDTSYVNFVRDLGSEGQRFDFHPRLSYPWSPGGLFTLTPRVGFRETIYDTEVIGSIEEQGVQIEDTRKAFTARTLFEAGADLEARAYRVFDMNGALGIQRLQHVIEPRVSYIYLNGDDPDNLPQWDGTDVIRKSNLVTYSLTNRVKARGVSDDDRAGRVWELMRFTLSQTYNVEPGTRSSTSVLPAPPTTTAAAARRRVGTPEHTVTTVNPDGSTTITTFSSNPRLSDVVGDLILEPVYGIRFRGTSSFDPYESRITGATTDLAYEATNWRVAFGTRHGENGKLDYIQGALQARIGNRWAFRFSTDYNVDAATVIENRFEVDFREQCWAITAAYINRTTDDEFHITVNLLELGQYGFGRAFAGFGGGTSP